MFGPPAPFDLPSPMLWSDPEKVERRFEGLASSIAFDRSAATFRFPSLDDARDFFRSNTGGEVILRQMLPPDRYAEFDERATDLVRAFARVDHDGVVVENAYLRVVARKA